MADDDGVGPHCLQGQGGVLQALALRDRGPAGREVDDVGGQPLGRELERDAGPGRVLVEQVHHRSTAEGRDLLDHARADLPEAGRRVEDLDDVVLFQLIDREQMLDHAGSLTPSPTTTESSPSTSAMRT